MKSDYPVILDACVLLPMPLADALLRMAESPRLFLPKWSDETLQEVTRNLVGKWNKTEEQAQRRENALRAFFPEALVEGYADLVPAMQNDPKDRHVLAAAVKSGARLIVTYNSKHFPQEALRLYDIERQGPSTFLIGLYDLEPGIVSRKLTEQAQAINISLEDLLRKLQKNVPGFVTFFCEEQKIDL
jgi:predicted nucleic acid-binding protein